MFRPVVGGEKVTFMKSAVSLLLLIGFLTGCASSTIDSRKHERASAYAALPAETKSFVDQGRLKVGMPEDAVYIAWGQPSEVLHHETEGGASTVWLYYGGWMEEERYWNHRRMTRDYQPRTYVRAEIVFIDGIIKSWRTLPQPVY
jgi:hypothetical protein